MPRSIKPARPQISTAEPRGWGRRQFVAALFLEDPTDGGKQILASDPVEDPDCDNPVAYVLQHYPREENSSQPTHSLGLAQQDSAGEWDEPVSLCSMFPPREEARERASAEGYAIPALSGQPRDTDSLDADDPACCRWEVWFATGPDGKEIPEEEARLFLRRRTTATEAPRASSVAEFLGI